MLTNRAKVRNYWGVLIVLSPAKSLDYESPLATTEYTEPTMLDRSEILIDVMRKKSAKDVATLMSISPTLAELNVEHRSTALQAAWDCGVR